MKLGFWIDSRVLFELVSYSLCRDAPATRYVSSQHLHNLLEPMPARNEEESDAAMADGHDMMCDNEAADSEEQQHETSPASSFPLNPYSLYGWCPDIFDGR
jgi:hypothetical protein